MSLIAGLFRLLLIGFILYVIFMAVRFIQALGRPPAERSRPRILGGKMVKDEFCETYLPVDEALREVVDGREKYFCSRECRDGFLEKRARSGDASNA
jgi:uncharacterized protein